jgi:hypothetical protein
MMWKYEIKNKQHGNGYLGKKKQRKVLLAFGSI